MTENPTELERDEILVDSPEAFVTRYQHKIKDAARSAYRDSYAFDRDDLEQEAWLQLLPRWQKLAGAADGFIFAAARSAMRQFAGREVASYEYFTGAFIYTPALVRLQLEDGVWDQDPESDWELRLDVQRAYKEALRPKDQELIFDVFGRGNAPTRTEAARHKAISRAIDRLTQFLNRQVAVELVPVHDAKGV